MLGMGAGLGNYLLVHEAADAVYKAGAITIATAQDIAKDPKKFLKQATDTMVEMVSSNEPQPFQHTKEYQELVAKYGGITNAYDADLRLTKADLEQMLKDYDAKKAFYRRWFGDTQGIKNLRKFVLDKTKLTVAIGPEGYVDLKRFLLDGFSLNNPMAKLHMQEAIAISTTMNHGKFTLTAKIYQKLIDAMLSYDDLENQKAKTAWLSVGGTSNLFTPGREMEKKKHIRMFKKDKDTAVKNAEKQAQKSSCFSYKRQKK